MWHAWETGEVHTGFRWEKFRERVDLECVGVDESIILKWILKDYDAGLDWIDLTQGRDKEGAVVNTVMNLRGP
jgi:hypothetical protein